MGKHFTEKERYKLESMLEEKKSVKEISERLGKPQRTIYSEIKRGTVELMSSDLIPYKKYCADTAQNDYIEKGHNKGRGLKIGNDIKYANFIEDKIMNEKYSPSAVLMYIKTNNLEFDTTVCFRTLYNYIDEGVFLKLCNEHLPVKKEDKRKKQYKRKVSLKNPTAKGIEERPEKIKDRNEYGHWEMDTVVSGKKEDGTQKGKSCLLVLSERMTREELILKLQDKKTASVVTAINRIERIIGIEEFRNKFKSITVDNGVEFADTDGIKRGKRKRKERTELYYCHPYSSYERGTNENINRMIWRFYPKGTNFDTVSDLEIAKLQDWINNYPRKLFGGLSSNQFRKTLLSA